MSDIFDEVDDILNEVNDDLNESSAPESVEAEKNFNESELQDIMAEIESLEKEFEEEVVAEEVTTKASIKEEKLKPVTGPTILPFDKKQPTIRSGSEISFQANGQMNLNLEFKIGDEVATLSVDPVKGLIVTMSGVELCINQEEGCKVVMENGMNFTIPLTSSASNLKKKSA
ncbi:MAG: hypothetical protein WC635_13145 [Bacteriovorax sp.]|jgi:hypothetical protein